LLFFFKRATLATLLADNNNIMINSTESTWAAHSTSNGSVTGSFEGGALRATAPTVLIPGIGATVLSLQSLTSALHERGNEVITVDVGKAGHRLRRPATLHAYAKLLMEAVVEELGDQPINVIGHSWGGILAQEIALAYPSRVKRLGLLATLPGGFPLYPPSTSTMFEMMQPDRSQDRLDRIGGKLYGGDFRKNPDLIKTLGIAHDVDREAYGRQHFAAVAGIGLFYQIGRIKQETLVIGGTDDPITPYQNSKELHRRISGSRLHTFQDEGHMFPMSRAGETAAVLDHFLNEAAAGSEISGHLIHRVSKSS